MSAPKSIFRFLFVCSATIQHIWRKLSALGASAPICGGLWRACYMQPHSVSISESSWRRFFKA